MKKRTLGASGLTVSAVGLGCMGMSQSYPPFLTQEEIDNLIRRAVEMGATLFDTSEVYGIYRNEEALGKALQPGAGGIDQPLSENRIEEGIDDKNEKSQRFSSGASEESIREWALGLGL